MLCIFACFGALRLSNSIYIRFIMILLDSLRKAKYYTCSLKKQIEDWIFLEREQRQLCENGVDFPSIQKDLFER